MAAAFGAKSIISCANNKTAAFVRQMGATQVIDYTKDNWWDVLADDSMDVVIDNYGGKGTPDRALTKLRKGAFGCAVLLVVYTVPPSHFTLHPQCSHHHRRRRRRRRRHHRRRCCCR
jgi:NADPH:quinone reductase-like Zn-dependent oxidoreductase